jgi:hypothetical protein
VGPWKAPIATTTPQRASLPHELLELRAIPVRVGGARRSVRFDSESEADSFTLDATEDQCRRVGAHLYKELDITAGVRRGADGKIEGGKLDDFICVDARDGGASWREWFRESAEDWSRATDVVGELGRRD